MTKAACAAFVVCGFIRIEMEWRSHIGRVSHSADSTGLTLIAAEPKHPGAQIGAAPVRGGRDADSEWIAHARIEAIDFFHSLTPRWRSSLPYPLISRTQFLPMAFPLSSPWRRNDMKRDDRSPRDGAEELPELELSDDDILDAMTHISGYIDVSTEDFREVYHLAHRHAVDRLFGRLRAHDLMRVGIPTLSPDIMLDEAARILAQSGYKGLPVVDADGRILGMLTETDYLRRLEAGSFLELFLRLIDDSCEITHRCHETPVKAAMIAPAVCVGLDAGFSEIMASFSRHPGRSAPVIDEHGRLAGLLLRKDFLSAFNLEARL